MATGFTGKATRYWGYYQVPILARAAFHPFNLNVLAEKIKVRDKLDVYVGPSMGWQIGWTNWKGSGSAIGSSPSYGGFVIREYIGARWFFTPNFAVTLEDCGGLGVINAGVVFKF